MKLRLLRWLCCPTCRLPDLVLDVARTEAVPTWTGHFEPSQGPIPGIDDASREEQEIEDGTLHCPQCRATFPIRDGIPRMLPVADEGPETAHKWTRFDAAVPAWEENFADLSQPLQPPDFLGKLALDAGCGFGRHAFFAGRYGAEVVALDSSGDAVLATRDNCRSLAHVHVVQGDLFRPPFRDLAFDLVWSFGVLHHLDAPHDAFHALGPLLRPGGRLSLWVYGHRQGTTAAATTALRGVTSGLEPEELVGVSRVLARGLRLFSHTPMALLGKTPVARSIVTHLPVHDHYRWPFDVVVADVYDRLRIPVRHWFTREELEVWLTEEGYSDVSVTRRIGNNETFRATGLRR